MKKTFSQIALIFMELETWQKWVTGFVALVVLANIYNYQSPEDYQSPMSTGDISLEIEKQQERQKLEFTKDSIRHEKQKLMIIEWRKENKKAAKILDKHPNWSRSDCESLVKKQVWVGMSYDMLKYSRGLPNIANPSDYGSGIQWQWCWTGYTPSCFYDRNDDGIIDSYN